MADFVIPDQAPYPRSALGWDGTDFYVISVNNLGEVDVNVIGSALPGGAATSANQGTMITALWLIDDLRNALASVDTDYLLIGGYDNAGVVRKLRTNPFGSVVIAGRDAGGVYNTILTDPSGGVHVSGVTRAGFSNPFYIDGSDGLFVKGQDQLFSFKEPLAFRKYVDLAAGGDQAVNTNAVPAGVIWVVTNILVRNETKLINNIWIGYNHDGTAVGLKNVNPPAANFGLNWSGLLTLDVNDYIRCWFYGCDLGDRVDIEVTGYIMTEE